VRAGLLFLLGMAIAAPLAAAQASCASGGSDSGGTAGDGGDDVSSDGPLGSEGGKDSGGGSGSSSGGAVSFSKACLDNAIEYCNQLQQCAPFLLQVEYGDESTCQSQLSPAFCMDIVTAPHTGWTAAGLEACAAARQKLSCQDFLYLKPPPASCRPTGTATDGAGCRYGSQCGSGYCRIPAGSMCGSCVALGNSASLCASSADCDSNLVCSGMGTCVAPAPLGGACDSMSAPCQNGLICSSGKCAVNGMVGASCDPDSGVGCDPALGAYCAAGSCAAVTVAMNTNTCGASPPTDCYGGGVCAGGFCSPPSGDGQPCEAGTDCLTPSTCNAGVCGLFHASMCH
jgi:hypothetical protein